MEYNFAPNYYGFSIRFNKRIHFLNQILSQYYLGSRGMYGVSVFLQLLLAVFLMDASNQRPQMVYLRCLR